MADYNELRKYLITMVEKTNDEPDVEIREKLVEEVENRVYEELGKSSGDIVIYDNGEIFNRYINWDSNSGFTFVDAHEDISYFPQYLSDEEIDNLDSNTLVELLTEDGLREEEWTDFVNIDEQDEEDYTFTEDGDVIADFIIELLTTKDNMEEIKSAMKEYVNDHREQVEADRKEYLKQEAEEPER